MIGGSVTAGRAVGVDGVHPQLSTERPAPRVEVHLGAVLLEPGSHQDPQAVEEVHLVGIEVLVLRVGVDRHLEVLASADRGDEVEGDHATLRLDQGAGVVVDADLHRSMNPTERLPAVLT
jgi:hypothetical protein